MRHVERYQSTLNVLDSSLAVLVGYIYGLDIDHRKVLLKACRIQGPFSTTSRYYTRQQELLEEKQFYAYICNESGETMPGSHAMTCWDIVQHYSPLFCDPISCGYISMLLRYLPYLDYTSAAQELQNAVVKEISASQGGGKTAPYINHRTSFYVERFHPYRPGFAPVWNIGNRLRGAARRVSKDLLVPRLGKKNIPLPSDYCVSYEPYEQHNFGYPIRTLTHVERVYYKTGVELYGGTEMRTVWRGNDLKPRVYYSRGASVHRASTYIQHIFNAFVDALENTHRTFRHNTSVLHPGKDDVLGIYDYSSFTSNLSEITRFTAILAEEFMEFYVTIMDPHFGPTELPIGVLLHEYNDNCNRNPKFDASEVLAVEEAVFNHNAGMLGVPGNISSCTLLHGIHLSILVMSVLKNKVVGDDAIYLADKDRELMIRDAIQDIGEAVVDKMERWEGVEEEVEENVSNRYEYKKRPINRLENLVLCGELVDFPALTLVDITNPFHRSYREDDDTRERKAITRFCRFNDVLSHIPTSEIGQHIVQVSSLAMYKMLGWNAEGGQGRHRLFAPPIAVEGLRYNHWILHFSDCITVRLPKVYIGMKSIPDAFREGQDFYRKSSPVVSYFCNIGVIEEVKEYEQVMGRDLIDYYGELSPRLLRKDPIRHYRIVERFPCWLEEYFMSFREVDTIEEI